MEELPRHKARHFMLAFVLAIVLIGSYNSAVAAPSTRGEVQSQCSTFCRSSAASVLKYEPREYAYEFQSEVTTSVDTNRPESRKTIVKAGVRLIADTPCSFIIRIKDLSVSNDGGQPKPVEGLLERNGGRFTLEDGVVGSFCLNRDEPAWTANIKRAIVSLLQNKAISQDGVTDEEEIETDISGKCPTKFEFSGGKYTKTKKLNACSRREGGLSLFHGVPYEVKSKNNASPHQESTQTCEQTIDNGIYKLIQCTENHVLRTEDCKFLPALKTTIKTSLTHKATRPGQTKVAPPANLEQSSILFDYVDTRANPQAQTTAKAEITQVLEQICSNIRPDGVTSEVSQEVLTLKKVLAKASGDDLKEIYGSVGSSICATQGDKLKKILIDAAALSASDASTELLADLYSKNTLDLVGRRYFYLYTGFATQPSEVSLRAVLPLINAENPKKRLLLTVSGLAYRYCKVSNPNCADNEDYQKIVDRIAAIAQQNCLNRDEAQLRLGLAALESLGNLNALTFRATGAVQQCLAEGTNRVKAVGLKSFRRDPCNPQLKAEAIGMFGTRNLPANIRINAFVASLRCLRPENVAAVQRIIEEEQSVQVGGFVSSYLKNLARNSSPSSRNLQSGVGKLVSSVKYPQEIRKFSRNFGSSMFNSDVNLGYSATGDVIFTKESFLPREIAANITLDINGNSYNVFDVGVYLENFDSLQESLFGPEGKLTTDNNPIRILNTIIKEPSSSIQSLAVTSGRGAGQQQPTGDLYLRIFGTTVSFVSFNSDSVSQGLENLKETAQRLIRNAVQTPRDVNLIAPILFADDEISVPTISGFALSNTIEGTVIPSLEYKKEVSSSGNVQDYKVRLVTNAATGIKAKHSVVGGPFENGIQLEVNLRTGGSVELALHSDDNNLEARVNLPNDKVRAFEFSSETRWVTRAPSQPEISAPYRQSLTVVPETPQCEEQFLNQLIEPVGLKVCVISTLKDRADDTPFLLNGKQFVQLSLEKTESSMEGYLFGFKRSFGSNKREFELTIDTPGSSSNRKVSVSTRRETTDEKTSVMVLLTTPLPEVNAKLEYEITNSDSVKGVEAKLSVPKAVYSVTGKVNVAKAGDEITYKPLLQLEYPGRKSGTVQTRTFLTGKIVHTPGSSLSYDLTHEFPEKLSPVRTSPMNIFLKGTVSRSYAGDDYSYKFEKLELATRNRDITDDSPPSPLISIDGNCKSEEGRTKLTTDLDITYGTSMEHKFTFNKEATRQPGKYATVVKTTSTHHGLLNIEVRADYRRSGGKYDGKYLLVVGPDATPQWSISSETHIEAESVNRFEVKNELRLRSNLVETFDLSSRVHVKNTVGEEQLVDVQLFNGAEGSDGKVLVKFERKAAQNNDFTLNVKYSCSKSGNDGELTHTRTTANEKDWTTSITHETIFTSQSLGVSRDHWITHLRLRNTENRKAVAVNSKLNLQNRLDLGLDFGAEMSPKKYTGKVLLKLNTEETGVIDLLILRSPVAGDTSVSLKSSLARVFKVDLTRKNIAENEAKTQFRAEYLPSGRVITLDVDRKTNGDTYDVNGELKWDAVKDATQLARIHSVTKVIRGSLIVDSKNEITVIDQKVQLNVDAQIPTDILRGQHVLGVGYTAPDGKAYKVDYKNTLGASADRQTANAIVLIEVPQVSPLELRLNLQSLNPQLSRFVFDTSAGLQVFTNGAKSHDLLAELKSTKEDGQMTRAVQAKLAAGGSAVPEPVLADVQLTVGQRAFSTKNSVQIGTNVIGVEVDVTDNKGTPALAYTFTNIPGLKYKKVEGTKTYNKQWDQARQIYVFGSTHAIKADDQPLLTYNYNLASESGQVQGTAGVILRGTPIFNGNVKGVAKPDDVALEGHLTFGEAKPFTWDVKFKNDDDYKSFVLGSGLDDKAFKIQIDLPERDVYNLTVNVQRTGSEYQGDLEIIWKENQKRLAAIATRNRGEVIVDLKLNKVKDASGAYKFDGSATHGTTSVSAEGILQPVSGGYEGSMKYQIPDKSGVAQFTVVIESNHRKISLIAGDQAKPIEFFTLDYTKELVGKTTKYDGSFSTDVVDVLFEEVNGKASGNFKAEYNRYSESSGDSETGRSFTSESTYNLPSYGSGTLKLQVKHTNREVRAFAESECTAHPKLSAELQGRLNLNRASKDLDGEVKALVSIGDDASGSRYGIVSSTRAIGQGLLNLDHKSELFFDKASIELHAYANTASETSCEGGVNLRLPARTLSLTYKKTSATTGEFSVWLDKARKPEQKLHVDVSFMTLATEDYAKGYKYSIKATHPSLTRPVTINRSVVRFGREVLLESETELDIFSDPNKKITVTAKLAWADPKHLNGKLTVNSAGLGIAFTGESKLETRDDSFDVQIDYTYNNRNNEPVTRHVQLAVSGRHQSLTIGNPASPSFLISRSLREGATRRRRDTDLSALYKSRDVIDVRYEFHLPGMVDNRVVDIYLQRSVPPQLSIKTSATSANPRRTYEVSLGFPTEQLLLLGLYKQVGETRTTLSEFKTALNGTNFLSIKASWNSAAIQQSLNQAQKRLSQTGANAETISEGVVSEVSENTKDLVEKLVQSFEDFKPLRDHIRTELQLIRTELVDDANAKVLAQAVESLCKSFELAVAPLEAFINDLPTLAQNLKETYPALTKQYAKLRQYFLRATGKLLQTLVKSLRPLVEEIKAAVERFAGKLQSDIQAGAEDAVTRVQTASDKFLTRLAERILERLDAINAFLESSPVNDQVKELITKLLKFAVTKLQGDEQQAAATQQEIIAVAKDTVKKLVREVFTVDLENGYVAVLIPLPRPVNSLYDVQRSIAIALTRPQIEIPYRNHMTAGFDIIRQFFVELARSDIWSALIAAFRASAPPQVAKAYIIGSQYFITFDGKQYHFEGDCKYQLIASSDLNVFLQFAKNGSRVTKSIIVEYLGNEVAAINSDWTPESRHPNGRAVWDTQTDYVQIDVGVKGSGQDQLSIVCRKGADVCEVRLENPYLYGKVSGLLGTYNNEQYDDFQTPSGTIANTIEEFTSSYRVGSCTESAAPEHNPVSAEAKRACSSAFTSLFSSLRPCFKLSNTSEFQQICEHLATEQGWSVDEAVCASAYAYHETCPEGLVCAESFCSGK